MDIKNFCQIITKITILTRLGVVIKNEEPSVESNEVKKLLKISFSY